MNTFFRSLVVFAAATILSPPVYAQQHGSGMREACKNDVEHFCSDMEKGGGRIIRCLMDHYNGLSPNCQNVLEKIKELRQQREEGRGEGRGSDRGSPPDNNGDHGGPPQHSGEGGGGPPPQNGGGGDNGGPPPDAKPEN